MDEDYKCNSCETPRPPTEMKDEDGRVYLFCSVCKKELKLEDILDRTVDEQKINLDINVYYDTNGGYVVMSMEDWQKILEVLKQSKANLTINDNKQKEK